MRRWWRARGFESGFLTGAALSLIVDEGVAPALGFSAPNTHYPMLTHLRGFLNHLAYGAAVGLTAEVLYHLTDTSPEQQRPWRGLSDQVAMDESGSKQLA